MTVTELQRDTRAKRAEELMAAAERAQLAGRMVTLGHRTWDPEDLLLVGEMGLDFAVLVEIVDTERTDVAWPCVTDAVPVSWGEVQSVVLEWLRRKVPAIWRS